MGDAFGRVGFGVWAVAVAGAQAQLNEQQKMQKQLMM